MVLTVSALTSKRQDGKFDVFNALILPTKQKLIRLKDVKARWGNKGTLSYLIDKTLREEKEDTKSKLKRWINK